MVTTALTTVTVRKETHVTLCRECVMVDVVPLVSMDQAAKSVSYADTKSNLDFLSFTSELTV